MYPQVFGYAATVFSFWWVMLGAWAILHGHVGLGQSLSNSVNVLILVSIGGILGCIGAVAWVILERQARREGLVSDKVRGLACSIGPVPLNAKEPGRSMDLPSFEGLPDVPAEFFPQWLARYQVTHPEHVALTKAMLQVYHHSKDLPATHVVGGHGGRTLLQHSLLVAYQMQNLATKWSYTGLRDRTGKKVLLKLRDGAYQFDATDPLVLLVGLAHDIGKIEAFIFENGKIVGSHHEHDLTGARMMARMPEMWDIPDADRVAILLAIAHYHHPMELPLSPDRRAIDDRTIAVMELLIKADFVASAIERKGVTPTEKDYIEEMDAREKSDISDEDLWIAFTEILNETGRINSSDLNYNVGTICQIEGQNAMRLVLHEPSIRGALMRRLGVMQSEQLGDGRHQLTIRLLKLIDDHGLLVKTIKDLSYAAESALWSLSFFGRKKTRGSNEAARLTGWPAAIVMLPSVTPFVAALPSYPWTGRAERGSMGKARAKAHGSELANEPSDAAIDLLQENTQTEGQPYPLTKTDLNRVLATDQVGAVDQEASAAEPPEALSFEKNELADESHLPLTEAVTPNAQKVPVAMQSISGKSATAKGQQRRHKPALDLSVLDKAKALMQTHQEQAQIASEPAKTDLPMGDPATDKQGPVGAMDGQDESFKHSPVQGVVLEGPSLNQFIVPAAAQNTEEVPAVSPYLLKQSVAKVIMREAMSVTETGGGRKIYLVSKLHLVKHVPDFDWSRASSDIMALCKSTRGAGFETIESGGDLYILVDALMIKEFMERSP